MSSTMPSLSPCVTCGICFEVMTTPVTMQCKHSFCLSCVQAQLRENGDIGFTCLLCAVCFHEVDSGNAATYSDESLKSYIDALNTGSVNQQLCQWCEAVVADMQCIECASVFCQDCALAVHKSASKRSHGIGKVTAASLNFYRRCQHRGHEEYRLEFYCVDCNEVCCAYCLQVGPHREHHHSSVSIAAGEARRKLVTDMQTISNTRLRLHSNSTELNRVLTLFKQSYDSVECAITERFETFRQQLIQRELEVRRTLTVLRDGGDSTLTFFRKQYLDRMNALNEALIRSRTVQDNGSDYQLLQAQGFVALSSKEPPPAISGTGFKLLNLGDVAITGLDLRLDLQAREWPIDLTRQPMNNGSVTTSMEKKTDSPPSNLTPPLRLTFMVDEDVQAKVLPEGVQLSCVARGGGSAQIGVRSTELFESILNSFPQDHGSISWLVRLDSISDSFLGVVERPTNLSIVPDGFYWKPACSGVVDGHIGRYTSVVRHLPVCSNGDYIRFTFDGLQGTLRIVVNEKDDRGIAITDLHSRIAACFIFYPGESLTVLF